MVTRPPGAKPHKKQDTFSVFLARMSDRIPPISTSLVFVLIFGFFSVCVAGFVFLFGLYITFVQSSDMILPGVTVGETRLSGLTLAQAEEELNRQWNLQRHIMVSDGQNSWVALPAELGLQMDTTATAQNAYQVGRGMDGLGELIGIMLGKGASVMPQVSFDQGPARATLQSLAQAADVPAYDATLQYQDGVWQALPGVPGHALDIEQALAGLNANAAMVLTSRYMPVPVVEVAPRTTDVSTSLEALQPLLNSPMRLQAYDPILDQNTFWEISPNEFAPWLRITQQDPTPVVSIDGGSLQNYLSSWQSTLGEGRTLQEGADPLKLEQAWKNGSVYTLIVWHAPTSYIVQPGDNLTSIALKVEMPYWKILEANPDLEMNNLTVGQTLVIPSKNEMLPLPVVLNKRIIISIPEQRMRTYENGSLLNEYIISTGIDSSPTMPGVYQVQIHEPNAYASVWDLYMPNFLGIYEGWPGFWNGFHGLPMLSSGVRLWANVLGSPASFGCIILDLEASETVYNWAEDGVVVQILP